MRAAVLGSPIGHSLSPALHRAAYSALGLDWSYDAIEVRPEGLAGFLTGLDHSWVGLSLTMPLKQTVLPLLDEVTELVTATGAANTVLLRGERRWGENTDVAGIVAALREAGVGSLGRATVVGGGATAASAVAALAQLGAADLVVLVRDRGRAGPLLAAAERLGVHLELAELTVDALARSAADVVVSTVPAGALDDLARRLALPARPPVLLDVVYAPWPTALASAYAGAGGTVVGGAAMLLHQAAAQVELMTGQRAPLAAMRAALPR